MNKQCVARNERTRTTVLAACLPSTQGFATKNFARATVLHQWHFRCHPLRDTLALSEVRPRSRSRSRLHQVCHCCHPPPQMYSHRCGCCGGHHRRRHGRGRGRACPGCRRRHGHGRGRRRRRRRRRRRGRRPRRRRRRRRVNLYIRKQRRASRLRFRGT